MDFLDKHSDFTVNKDAFGRVRIWQWSPEHGIEKLLLDKSNLITKQGADITAQALGSSAWPNVSTFPSNAIMGVTVTNPGSGYVTAPSITFSAPTSGTTATGTTAITNSTVTGVTITNAGTGYIAAPPTVAFSAPSSGITATGVATITGGVAPVNKNVGLSHIYVGYSVSDGSTVPPVTTGDTISSFSTYSRVPLAFSPGYANEAGYSSNLVYFTIYVTGTTVPNNAYINSLGLVSATGVGDMLFSRISFTPIQYSSSTGLAITWGITLRATS